MDLPKTIYIVEVCLCAPSIGLDKTMSLTYL